MCGLRCCFFENATAFGLPGIPFTLSDQEVRESECSALFKGYMEMQIRWMNATPKLKYNLPGARHKG